MELYKKVRTAALKAARRIAEEVGKEEVSASVGKGYGGDVTRKIDLVAENTILRELADVPAAIITEERGVVGSGEYKVIVDPLDGSQNAIRGVPFYAVSIAVSKTLSLSDVEYGVVVDVVRDNVFEARKGEGAFLNGRRLKVKPGYEEDKALVSIMLPRDDPGVTRTVISTLGKIGRLRSLGAGALEISYVASGVLDAYVNLSRIRIFDIAAADLILREAGGFSEARKVGERNVYVCAAAENVFNVIKKSLGW